ncbi:MAG: hypothetical protein KIS90_01940 [Phenylobacterium sp.]|nr:hypothetical protein [Phenylobacterium sp.]MCW5758517.1 hypothetical protein [Phenylobacterium sp.]
MHAAEKAHGAIEATEDAAELCALISALSKAGRVLRMSIALETKLARDAGRDAAVLTEKAVATRKARLAGTLDRMIWTQMRPMEAEAATADLRERLEAEALLDGFADEPVEAQVERIAGLLGLTGEAIGPYVPASLRHRPSSFRHFWGDDEAWEDEAGEDEAEDDETEGVDAVARPSGEPQPNPDPFNGRLAPPIDLPSWECDDDTS